MITDHPIITIYTLIRVKRIEAVYQATVELSPSNSRW